jgi:hypothetical protein
MYIWAQFRITNELQLSRPSNENERCSAHGRQRVIQRWQAGSIGKKRLDGGGGVSPKKRSSRARFSFSPPPTAASASSTGQTCHLGNALPPAPLSPSLLSLEFLTVTTCNPVGSVDKNYERSALQQCTTTAFFFIYPEFESTEPILDRELQRRCKNLQRRE